MVQFQKDALLKEIKDFGLIKMDTFLQLLNTDKKQNKDLFKGKKILELLRKYENVLSKNSESIRIFHDLIHASSLTLRYIWLSHEKDIKLKELEILKHKKTSNELAAKNDLLKKLSEDLQNNKEQLTYMEEDYLHIKNQRDQILNTIENYKSEIKDLNLKKKDKFNQINKITREMSKSSPKESKDKIDLGVIQKPDYSKSEKIRILQREAREIQNQIKQINSKINESEINLEKISPNYYALEKDYQKLSKNIKRLENRLEDLKSELKVDMRKNSGISTEDLDIYEIDTLKTTSQIEIEIQEINKELNSILEDNRYMNQENPKDLSKLLSQLENLNDLFQSKEEILTLPYENELVIEYVDSFRKIEDLKNELINILNKFLMEINIEVNFQICMRKNYEQFIIESNFLHLNKKKNLKFDELTTPEKIFFVISFYISLQVILDSKNIIFSNLYIPKQYNKRGSIYRTITKLLPIFEKERYLQDQNLVFIISSLEMQKVINGLKIIKIE